MSMMERAIDKLDTVQDPGEDVLSLHSSVSNPITELSFLKRSLLFAELAMVSYNDEDEARRAAKIVGFDDTTFYDRDGSQANRFRNDHDCVIACRGTEPNEWNDIKADANATSVLAETVGKVHQGFKTEVDDLWPMLETALVSNDQSLWFCGHSLGGAMATICASRCFLSHIESVPEQLFTYGSPRVGNKQYVGFVELDYYRYVNNNDIVTRVPPVLFGYRHCGQQVYLNRNGEIVKLGHVGRRRDRWKGFFRGLRRGRIDHFTDHSIHQYINAIVKECEEEDKAIAEGKPPESAEAFAANKPKRPKMKANETSEHEFTPSGG